MKSAGISSALLLTDCGSGISNNKSEKPSSAAAAGTHRADEGQVEHRAQDGYSSDEAHDYREEAPAHEHSGHTITDICLIRSL